MTRPKPWQQYPKPPRRTAPEELAKDRPPDARQPGESLPAYRAFLGYLQHGSIRRAANALGTSRTVFERWSKRWRWPARKSGVLVRHAHSWTDLLEHEENNDLPAAADADELDERQWTAFMTVTSPKVDRDLKRMLKELGEAMKGYGLP